MSAIRFNAQSFTINSWLILKLPKEASVKLPSRGQVMVRGTINGVEFQTALEPDGNGSHWFRIDKNLEKLAKAGPGNLVELIIEATKEWPEPDIPADLAAALKAHARIRALWADITPMARWEWIRWIGATNNSETRERRIEVACSKLRAGMRRPCCFNRSMCCVPEVSKSGVLLDPTDR